MKKLITFTLILALLLPATVLAEERDPIVGNWYILFDGNIYPEIKSAVGNMDSDLSVYYFNADGSIMLLDNPITDGSSDPTFAACGKWEIINDAYKYSIIGLGTGNILLSGDELLVELSEYGIYMVMRKIIPFNPYEDYVRRSTP